MHCAAYAHLKRLLTVPSMYHDGAGFALESSSESEADSDILVSSDDDEEILISSDEGAPSAPSDPACRV